MLAAGAVVADDTKPRQPEVAPPPRAVPPKPTPKGGRPGEINTPAAKGERQTDRLKVGDVAPNFTLATLDGKDRLTLAKEAAKNSVNLFADDTQAGLWVFSTKQDGTKLVFNNRVKNIKTLGELIQQEVTRHLLPRALDTYHHGKPVTFGNLAVRTAGTARTVYSATVVSLRYQVEPSASLAKFGNSPAST